MHFLRLLEGIRLPALDVFFGAVTYLGDELAFMVLAFALFWCVDKRTGYYAFVAGLFGTIGNQFLKIVCRIPRPWVLDPDFTIVESARAAATGYSFPSGHTQNADLRPREADAVGVVHGFEHVVEERRQTVVKFCDRAAFFCQNRVSHRYDLSQCHTGILLII